LPSFSRDHLPSRGLVRTEIIIILVLWFAIYVVYDVASTAWLINNAPIGLAGEQNPIGQFLFRYGILGALVAKVVGFITLSAAVIYVDSKYGGHKRIKELVEVVLLVLITVSLLAALQNFMSILQIVFFIR
jgi:hypothetical protein